MGEMSLYKAAVFVHELLHTLGPAWEDKPFATVDELDELDAGVPLREDPWKAYGPENTYLLATNPGYYRQIRVARDSKRWESTGREVNPLRSPDALAFLAFTSKCDNCLCKCDGDHELTYI